MLCGVIENALSDAVHLFHVDALSSTTALIQVRFHRRAHLPIVLASGLLDAPITVPWWNGMRLRLTA